jgi:hypothetical protein
MSKKTAPNKMSRKWRRARNAAMMQTLSAVAALEGYECKNTADPHIARHNLVAKGMDKEGLNLVMYNAAREFERAHPRGEAL